MKRLTTVHLLFYFHARFQILNKVLNNVHCVCDGVASENSNDEINTCSAIENKSEKNKRINITLSDISNRGRVKYITLKFDFCIISTVLLILFVRLGLIE